MPLRMPKEAVVADVYLALAKEVDLNSQGGREGAWCSVLGLMRKSHALLSMGRPFQAAGCLSPGFERWGMTPSS